MLIPSEELKMLYSGAIRQMADAPPRALEALGRHQGGFRFHRGEVEFLLSFDAAESPEIMTLQTMLTYSSGLADLPSLSRLAVRYNTELRGVKVFLVEAPIPFLVLSVEAILAAARRIPHSEVAEVILHNATQRLEDALDKIRQEAGSSRRGRPTAGLFD